MSGNHIRAPNKNNGVEKNEERGHASLASKVPREHLNVS